MYDTTVTLLRATVIYNLIMEIRIKLQKTEL